MVLPRPPDLGVNTGEENSLGLSEEGVGGDVLDGIHVVGNVEASGVKNFKIDHPLDPANKYLLHASVESPEVLNVYSGNVTTDDTGRAEVVLPNYFEAINRDFRYQLTVIEQFAQAIIVSEIKENRFTIATDKPNVKVSWQVTVVRNDAYMRTHPMSAEVDKKGRERGTYLQPEVHGQPPTAQTEYERMQRLLEEPTPRSLSDVSPAPPLPSGINDLPNP